MGGGAVKDQCFECGSEEAIHQHHVVPKSRGGTRTIPLCAPCHGRAHGRRGADIGALVSDKLRQKVAQGLQAGGEAPFGFMHEGGRIVQNPRERATMERIRELRRSGVSLRAIVADLNANKEQFPPRGKQHHLNTVASVLRYTQSEEYTRMRIAILTYRAENLLRKLKPQ